MKSQFFVEIQNQLLGATLEIAGTPFSLNYRSDRVFGRQAAYTIDITISGKTVPGNLKCIELNLEIAGQHLTKMFSPIPNQVYSFTWDGKNEGGKTEVSKHPLKIKTCFIYSQAEKNQVRERTLALGAWNARALGLGGWSFDIHHLYNRAENCLYLGNGRRRKIELPVERSEDIAIPDESGTLLYIFDLQGRHQRTFNTIVGQCLYQFEYDRSGFLCAIKDRDGNITRIDRHPDGRTIAIVAPYTQQTQLHLNPEGYLERAIDPAGRTTQFGYGNAGLLTRAIDPQANIDGFEYDALGRLKSRIEPDGCFVLLDRTRTEKGFKVAKITTTGRESTYLTERLATGAQRQINQGCGGAGAIVAIADSEGTETMTYPDGSVVIQETQPDPRFGQLAPIFKRSTLKTPGGLTADLSLARSIELTNPEDPLSLTKFTETADFNGRISTITYDATTRQIAYRSAAGRCSILTLDNRGRVCKSEIPGLEPVTFDYDGQGRLSTVKQDGQTVLSYGYDSQGRLCDLKNAIGDRVRYAYDKAGRIARTTLPSGKTYQFAYDANDNLTQLTVPSGTAHHLNYTAVNAEAGYVPPDNPPYINTYDRERQLTQATLPSGRQVAACYNKFGNLIHSRYPEAAIDITYEEASQKITQLRRTPTDGSPSQTLTYSYDGGLVTSMAWQGVTNGRYRYRYDRNFFLVGIGFDEEPEIEMVRDEDGLLVEYGSFQIQRDDVTGAPTQIKTRSHLDRSHPTHRKCDRLPNGDLTIDFEYDRLGRLTRRTHTINDREIYQLQLTYDPLSRIARKREVVAGTPRTYDYTYDADSQLIQVRRNGEVSESYTYDDNGNRLAWQCDRQHHTARYDSQDRLIEADGVPYRFDADGFLMQRGETHFKYSAAGELLEVVFPDGRQVTYTYDSMNRRVARHDVSGTDRYLYGNLDRPFQVTAVREASGYLTTYHYDDLGSLFAIRRGDAWYFVATDQLGTPQVICNVGGQEIEVSEYDSFGRLLTNADSDRSLSIGFAGGIVDLEAGLVRFGFRDYETKLGKWTAKDPIGFAGGDGNLYGYVENDAVNWIDSNGLKQDNPFHYDRAPHNQHGGPHVDYKPHKGSKNYRYNLDGSPKPGSRPIPHSLRELFKKALPKHVLASIKKFRFGVFGGVSILEIPLEILDIHQRAEANSITFQEQLNSDIKKCNPYESEYLRLSFPPYIIPNPKYQSRVEI